MPVAALVALAEGGYGVEVVEDGARPLRRGEDRRVRRAPGRGQSGDGLAEGDEVVVTP